MNGESSGNVIDDVPKEWIRDYENYAPILHRLFQIGPYPPQSPTRKRFNSSYPALLPTYDTLYSQQSLPVYHVAIYLSVRVAKALQKQDSSSDNEEAQPQSDMWDWLTVPTQRPQNTQQFNAIAYLASNCVPFRDMAARILSQSVVPVHFGKSCPIRGHNATQIQPALNTGRKKFSSNHVLFQHYKYCLVMENFKGDGYMTEKIFNAFWGGCLPIYYGTKEVYNVYHPSSFVYYDIDDPEPALDLLKRLEANATLYHEMLSAPILLKGKETFDQYFSLLPVVGDGSVNGKIRHMMEIDPIN